MHMDYDLCVLRTMCRFNFTCVEMRDVRRLPGPDVTRNVEVRGVASRRIASSVDTF